MAGAARPAAGAVCAQGRPRVGVRTLLALAAALNPASMSAAVWSIGAAPPVAAQVAGNAAEARARIADLADYIERSMPDWDLPGLAVGVVYRDEVIFLGGFGVKEMGRDDPIDVETLFQIGSVSKSFAAGAVGALVDDGLVDWDDPVVEHLPWFRVKDPWITRSMTIRDILSHRSGMPGDAYPVLAVMDAREAAERLRLPDNQAPLRQGYRYSNQGYGVAGLVVEAVTGMTWGEWVHERIFTPLGMHRSAASPYEVWDGRFVATAFLGTAPAGTVSIADAQALNIAMPHGFARDGSRRVLSWQSYDSMQAAGSVVSSVADLVKWIRMHLGGGRLDGEVVMREATVSEMHAPQVHMEGSAAAAPLADGGRAAYGLGWSLNSFEGHRYISHSGGIFGFPAYVGMLPEAEAGVTVLANGSMWTPYYPHREIAAWVFARLLGAPERDWHGEIMARTREIEAQVEAALAAQDAARIAGTAPSLPLERYTGSYEHVYGGRAHVELMEGGLRVHFGQAGSFSGDMEHWHHDVFRLHYDGGDGQAYGSSFVTFTLGPQGSVSRMDMGFMGRYRRSG
ncbi:MAG: serine hydrolase [Gemmatimonadetes bacterium]|nr:serine hydrolase [Gemmatimonadota bacterium]MYC93089.1 serine hydrolase [Gemmatimonadota bacterium]